MNHTTSHPLRSAALLALLVLQLPVQAQEADSNPREPQAAELMPLADEAIINDIATVDGRLVAVGERGHIVVSKDDGETWDQVASPVRAMLNQVEFVDDSHGWAVGHDGSVLHSDDGGRSWALQHFDSEWGKPFYDVFFYSLDEGLVAGANGRLLRTKDGGENWQPVESEVLETGFNAYDLARLGDGTLVIAGERGFLARSQDLGRSWEMIEPPYIGSYFGVMPVGNKGAIYYGLQGRVFLAQDVSALNAIEDPFSYDPFINESVTDPVALERLGWKRFDNPSKQSLFGGDWLGNQRFVLVGVDGTVVAGSDDDSSLEQVSSPTDQPLSSVVVHDEEMVLGGRGGSYQRAVVD